MANITIGTKTYVVTAQTMTRLNAWAAATYPTIPNPAYDPVSNPGVSRTLPNPDPLGSACDAIRDGLWNNVKGWEKAQALAAVASPSDLT